MDDKKTIAIGRRDLLRVVASVGIATAALSASPGAEKPKPADNRGKRRSQYQGNAPEVQTFYRVNAYPMK
ncbi:MAG: hypothetical protein QOK23_566 [Gammaproteobacteria bacterium]|jgi:hypothetical protein|nr:hypothetical protein [Gammaproteobacteria bacterium]